MLLFLNILNSESIFEKQKNLHVDINVDPNIYIYLTLSVLPSSLYQYNFNVFRPLKRIVFLFIVVGFYISYCLFICVKFLYLFVTTFDQKLLIKLKTVRFFLNYRFID